MLKKFYELAMEKIFKFHREKELLMLDIFPGDGAFYVTAKK